MQYIEKIFENELIYEKYIIEEDSTYNNYTKDSNFLNNNNDAFNCLFCFFSCCKVFIYLLHECLISFLKNVNCFLNQIQIFFCVVILYFRLVFCFESNSNISTNLIISAYFHKKNYTHITYEEVLENGKKIIKLENNINNNEIIEEYDENIFSFQKILISFLCSFLLFLVIKLTIRARIKNFISFNLFAMYISFNLVTRFYKDKNYFSSSFMFILLIYFDKNLLDSIFIKLRFQKKDFEIFSRNLISNNTSQFILKFLSLINITFFSLYFSLLQYNFWLNYFINYLCILSFLSFIGNCLERFFPFYLKPIKYIMLFLFGVSNIFFSKFFLKKIFFGEKKYTRFYSLYLINDLFSSYCLNFINYYIEYQYKYVLNINIKNNNNKKNHYLLEKNAVWICFLFISISLGYLGVFFHEYIFFIISLFITKKFMYYFIKFYSIKISRILNDLIIFNLFLFLQKLKNLDDFYFLFLLKHKTNLDNQILTFSLEFIFLLFLLYYIITTNFILYLSNEELNIKKNNLNIIESIIYILIELLIQFLIMYLIIKMYKNEEKNQIINILNLFALIIYHILKIPTMNELKKKNEENLYYNFYIFIWVIISLILIELSGPEISLLYLVNHINLIFFINFFILNDRNNNIFKIIVILILLIDYYRLHSCLFIVDAIAIIIYPIIKNLKGKEKNKFYNYDDRYRINQESIKAYNKLTFSFALFLLLFSLLEII